MFIHNFDPASRLVWTLHKCVAKRDAQKPNIIAQEPNIMNLTLFLLQRKGTSSSSVPKSTSSMTLPVSSPSSHSQFEEAGHHAVVDKEQQGTRPAPSSPAEVERRLDELSR